MIIYQQQLFLLLLIRLNRSRRPRDLLSAKYAHFSLRYFIRVKHKLKMMDVSKILYTFLLLVLACCQPFMAATPTDSKASETTDYTFELYQDLDYTVPAGSAIIITFPAEFQPVVVDGPYVCLVSAWIDSTAIPSISCALSGLTITISGGFPTTVTALANTYYSIIVEGLHNPLYSGTTAAFTGMFQDSSSNVIFSFESNFGFEGVVISEGILTCLITSTPTQT